MSGRWDVARRSVGPERRAYRRAAVLSRFNPSITGEENGAALSSTRKSFAIEAQRRRRWPEKPEKHQRLSGQES
jgi:hypothetical protein